MTILIENLFAIFGTYQFLISFFGAFIAGAETVLILTILASRGILNIWVVIIFSTLGIFTADLMWFSIGKIDKLSHLKKIPCAQKTYEKSATLISKTKNKFVLLSITKFVYGIGIPIMMYLGRREMNYKTFIKYNSLIILFWVSGIGLIGWLAGKGFTLFYDTLKNLRLAILVLVIAILVLSLLKMAIKKVLFTRARK